MDWQKQTRNTREYVKRVKKTAKEKKNSQNIKQGGCKREGGQ